MMFYNPRFKTNEKDSEEGVIIEFAFALLIRVLTAFLKGKYFPFNDYWVGFSCFILVLASIFFDRLAARASSI